MRKVRITLLLVAVAMVVTTVVLGELWASPTTSASRVSTRVAACDIVRVFREYKRANDLNTELRAKELNLTTQEEKKQVEIKSLQREVAELNPNSEEYQNRFEEFLRKAHELEAWKKAQTSRLFAWHYRLTEEMFKEVLDAVEAIANREDYQLVLFKEPTELRAKDSTQLLQMMLQRKVLYVNPHLDITDKVLGRLNGNYISNVPR